MHEHAFGNLDVDAGQVVDTATASGKDPAGSTIKSLPGQAHKPVKLVFALHPLQVEAVAWTSGMKDLLCTMFILLTLSQYILFADPQSDLPRSRRFAQPHG